MKPISFKTRFNDIFQEWMEDTVEDIRKTAIALVSGPLLKVASGLLVSSFHTSVEDNGHIGLVWNDAPYALIWEEEGIQYKSKNGKKRQVVKIEKRGAIGPRSQMGTIYRSLNYNKTKDKKPVHFMWTAVRTEMTGARGGQRLNVLAYETGYAIARRYVDMVQQRYNGGAIEVWELK